MWSRINGFIRDFGVSAQVSTGDYIPESLFYMLAMKANNETARKFQMWLANDVIPTIRKTGGYITGATVEETKKVIQAYKASKYLTDSIHDRKSVRKLIRNNMGMSIQKTIDEIIDTCVPIKSGIKHQILDSAITELQKQDNNLDWSTAENTYIKNKLREGIIDLQAVKIDKYKRKLNSIA